MCVCVPTVYMLCNVVLLSEINVVKIMSLKQKDDTYVQPD